VLPINSFWLSGTGALAPCPATTTPPKTVNSLRDAALNEDWAAWAQAWQVIDDKECAALLASLKPGHSAQLTLCGERSAQSFSFKPQSPLKRFMNLFSTQSIKNVLNQL
jgi:hypothetical protein